MIDEIKERVRRAEEWRRYQTCDHCHDKERYAELWEHAPQDIKFLLELVDSLEQKAAYYKQEYKSMFASWKV